MERLLWVAAVHTCPRPLRSHPAGILLSTSHRTLKPKILCQIQILRASEPVPHLQNDESGMMAVPNTARTNVNARPRRHQISTISPTGASSLYALPLQPRGRVVETHTATEMERTRKVTARARGRDQDPRPGPELGRVPGHTQAPGRTLPGHGQDRDRDRDAPIPTHALDPVLIHAHAHEPPHEEHQTAPPRPRAIATPTSLSAPTSNLHSSCAATRSPSPKFASLPTAGGLPLLPLMAQP